MIERERPEWAARGKCCGSDPAFFYPERDPEQGKTATTRQAQAAKAVCNGRDGAPICDVRQECLDYAIENNEKFGIWGGRSERERNRLKRMRKKVAMAPRVVRTVKRSPLRQILDTAKYETRILGAIQRHLLIRPADERDATVIHPSEMAKADWCPRATFFRLVEAPAKENGDGPSFTLENIWAEGHDIHGKWQTWLWEMGLLRGVFHCNACSTDFEATAPELCRLCKAPRACLAYREVPLSSAKYRLGGHADGDIADDEDEALCPLLEVKSIGVGTLRFESPKLLAKYTRKAFDDDGDERSLVDFETLWRDIRRPFPSHLRQCNLYMLMSGRKTMVVIYENKWNQQVKEFRIKYQPSIIRELLDACLDIQYGLESGRPPRRPAWADTENSTCSKCPYLEHCWDPFMSEDIDAGQVQHRTGKRRVGNTGQGRPRTRRPQTSGASGLRNTKGADQGQ